MLGGQAATGKSGWAYSVEDDEIDWHNLSDQQKVMLLTRDHEVDHFDTLVGNPTGLLMWRCNETLVDDISLLMRMLSDAGLRKIPGWIGLLDWFSEEGERFLETAFPADAEGEGASQAKAIRNLVEEIWTISEFSDVLFGTKRSDITVGAFVDLANRAYSILCERWGIPRRAVWKCHDREAHVPLYQDEKLLTVTELMEASARLRERGAMDGAGADPATIERWERESLSGVYRNGYLLFHDTTHNAAVSHRLIRLALASPIDPSCIPEGCGVLTVEDVVPAYRAIKLLTTYKRAGIMDEAGRKAFLSITNRMGWQDAFCLFSDLLPASEVIGTFLRSGRFPAMRVRHPWRKPSSSGPQLWSELGSAAAYQSANIHKFVEGFRKYQTILEKERNEYGTPVLGPDGRPSGIVYVRFKETEGGYFLSPEIARLVGDPADKFFAIQPDIMFYSDTVEFCNHHRSKDVFNYHHNVVHCIYSEACRNLLHRMRPKPNPLPLFRAFIARLTWSGEIMKDTSPYAMEWKRIGKADEDTAEWQALRRAWTDIEQAGLAMDEYLKAELGEAGFRSLIRVQ
jgi:hypothetical protein